MGHPSNQDLRSALSHSVGNDILSGDLIWSNETRLFSIHEGKEMLMMMVKIHILIEIFAKRAQEKCDKNKSPRVILF